MIQFLRQNQQVFILFIILYCLFIVFSVYFTHTHSEFIGLPFNFPFLYDLPIQLLNSKRAYFLLTLLFSIILLVVGFYMTRITVNFMIISRRSQFTALFYVTIASFAFKTELFSGAVIASLFILFAFQRVIHSLKQRGRSYHFLDAGILLACGSFFYLHTVFLVPLLWIAQIILKNPSFKELSYTLVGLLLPYVYLVTCAYLFDWQIIETWNESWTFLSLRKHIDYNLPLLSGLAFYLLFIAWASVVAIQKFGTTKIQVRKLFQVLFFMFLNLILIALLIPSTGIEIIYLLAIPTSVLFSIYFTDCRATILNRLLFFLLISIPIAVNLAA